MRGTTRDYLVARLDLTGVECELVDTAGVDSEPDATPRVRANRRLESAIDDDAQVAAVDRQREADIRVWCVDAAEKEPIPTEIDAERDILVLTKSDLSRPDPTQQDLPSAASIPRVVASSCTGEGLCELRALLRTKLIAGDAHGHTTAVAATAERCRESVRRAADSIGRAGDLAIGRCGDELVAAEIRTALDELGRVVGAVYTDDLLDRIFGTFCIGK
jgi:tRNA modification GTPase